MAASLHETERQYLLAAIDRLGELGDKAPQLRGYALRAFDTCRSLLEMEAEIPHPEGDADDFWLDEPDGSGDLSPAEAAALSSLAASLRLVVNGCVRSSHSFRSSVASTTRFAETLVRDLPAAHLSLVSD